MVRIKKCMYSRRPQTTNGKTHLIFPSMPKSHFNSCPTQSYSDDDKTDNDDDDNSNRKQQRQSTQFTMILNSQHLQQYKTEINNRCLSTHKHVTTQHQVGWVPADRGQLSSKPAPDSMAYSSFCLKVSSSLNSGSLRRFMHVDAVGSLSGSLPAWWTQKLG